MGHKDHLQVEAPQVNGHAVKLVSSPSVMVSPEIVTQLLRIPVSHLSKVSSTHLCKHFRLMLSAPWWKRRRPLKQCNLVQDVASRASAEGFFYNKHMDTKWSRRSKPVLLCSLSRRSHHESKSSAPCLPGAVLLGCLVAPCLVACPLPDSHTQAFEIFPTQI